MARQFGNYGPSVPLGLTWEESIELTDQNDTPINLTGYAVRAQLRTAVPTKPSPANPVLEITTPSYYGSPPVWPVVEGFSVPTPSNGVILLAMNGDEFSDIVSPTNEQAKLVWDIRLVNPITGYAIPVVKGKVTFKPATTL